MTLRSLWNSLQQTIDKYRKNGLLCGEHLTVLAASKGQPPSRLIEAIEAGIRDFGENRVQEAEDKWPPLKQRTSDLRLHLIGPLQTNKVKQAVSLFDVLQTVDRPELADALAKEMGKTGKRPACFIQVNTGKEPQKAGVIPEEADALIAYCRTLHLPLVGLMAIPPAGQPPAPHFALLKTMADRHGLKELSMGMSDDYETAIRMGSTCIRLGRALFGERA